MTEEQLRPTGSSQPAYGLPRRRRRLSLTTIILSASSLIAVLFLGLPQLALLIRGIQTRGWEGLSGAGVSEALVLSLITTALSSVLTVAIGTPLAYVFARRRFLGRRILMAVVELPIVLPPTVAGLALLITLGRRGMLGALLESANITLPFTTAAVIVAQSFVSAPFYIRAAQVGFASISRDIEEAAHVDGAQGAALFRHVTLPLSATALAAGLTLSWARALGEFGATILFAGNLSGSTQTMPLFVYTILESNLDTAIWASLILLVLAFLALVSSRWLSQRSEIQL